MAEPHEHKKRPYVSERGPFEICANPTITYSILAGHRG